MNPPTPDLAEILTRLTFAQATDLARGGNFAGAEAMLSDLLQSAKAPPALLDLQARIGAQQGRLGEAVHRWQKLLDQEPRHAAAQAALARLHGSSTPTGRSHSRCSGRWRSWVCGCSWRGRRGNRSRPMPSSSRSSQKLSAPNTAPPSSKWMR